MQTDTRVVYAIELWPGSYGSIGIPLEILREQKDRLGHHLPIVRIEVVGLCQTTGSPTG